MIHFLDEAAPKINVWFIAYTWHCINVKKLTFDNSWEHWENLLTLPLSPWNVYIVNKKRVGIGTLYI